jgi:type IX secretion system PorP/SprF family membrane protein
MALKLYQSIKDNTMNQINKISIVLICIISLTYSELTAQQHMEIGMSQYFRNRLIWNPAYTGVDGNRIYAMQNRSWGGFDGAPVLTSLSGELNFGKNSAAGVQMIADKAGVLNRTNGLVNYSYKVQFSEDKILRLGVGLAFNAERLDGNLLNGAIDPAIINNVNSKFQFDGNFGAVYQNGNLDLGISFNRIGNNLRKDISDNANYAVSQLGFIYRLNLTSDEKVLMRTIAMSRIYRETEPIFDIGAEFSYNDMFQVTAIYQTVGNVRAGAGIRKAGLGELNFFYNTNSRISNNASQQYEIGVGFYFKKRD